MYENLIYENMPIVKGDYVRTQYGPGFVLDVIQRGEKTGHSITIEYVVDTIGGIYHLSRGDIEKQSATY